jgi:uncharacterized protein YkwD
MRDERALIVPTPLYCRRQTASACRARWVKFAAGVHGLLSSFQNLRAAVRATTPSIYARLQQHRAITRVSLATLALAVALGVSLQDAAAGPNPANAPATSILPESVGTGVLTTAPVTLTFDEAMDSASVDANLALNPDAATRNQWSEDRTRLTLWPSSRWSTDARYVVAISGAALKADGSVLGGTRQVAFTTQTAPTVADFRVHLLSPEDAAPNRAAAVLSRAIPYQEDAFGLGVEPLIDAPEDTAGDVSAETGIRISFSAPMDRADVEARFSLLPKVRGSFSWDENQLVYTPSGRLEPGTRYAVSLVGAHDKQGNALAGDVSFSFTTRVDAELIRFSPGRHERDVMARQITIRFSQPMDARLTHQAMRVVDVASGDQIGGTIEWSKDRTELRYVFTQQLPRGRTIEASLSKTARDQDGNRVSVSWRFETRPPKASVDAAAPATAPAPVGGPAAPADIQEFALWQINQSRADYGLPPLRLDAAISKVASGHAWDQIKYGYFSHTGRDGSRVSDRLRRAGISFSYSGENMCYYNGLGLRAMLEWCHSTFMSEPYPGFANHIGNILGTHYTRLGLGIAQSGGKVIIVWDFAG